MCSSASSARRLRSQASRRTNVRPTTPLLLVAAALLAFVPPAAQGAPGLSWSRYDGSASGMPFSTGVPSASGTSSAVDLATLSGLPSGVYDRYAIAWRGFFRPPDNQGSTWCFRTTADDAAGVWVGAAALSPSSSNAVELTTSYTSSWSTGCTTLYPGAYYAITVLYRQDGGACLFCPAAPTMCRCARRAKSVLRLPTCCRR